MEFINPNKFEQMMQKEEGINNPDDVWDMTTFAEMRRHVENMAPNIEEVYMEEDFTPAMERCRDKVRLFCNQLTTTFREEFLILLDKYQEERRPIDPKIIEYLIHKELIAPSFVISHGEQAQKILDEDSFDYYLLGDQRFLLVFQLPKPLAQFWWKGGTDSWGDAGVDIGDTSIEWGHFYRELMPVVWAEQGRCENELGLDFQRINSVGEHDPQRYYYMWEMSEWAE